MREWLITNGLGSYASLTYSNSNSRKFHGLLVASMDPPTQRRVFMTNVYERIQIDEKTYDLKDLDSKFSFDIFPSFSYEINGVKIKKTVFMEHGKNTTFIRYKIKTDKPISLICKPVINSRHFYDLTDHKSIFRTRFTQTFADFISFPQNSYPF